MGLIDRFRGKIIGGALFTAAAAAGFLSLSVPKNQHKTSPLPQSTLTLSLGERSSTPPAPQSNTMERIEKRAGTATSKIALSTAGGMNRNPEYQYPYILDQAPGHIKRSQPLFEGQTNYPLTADEMAFLKQNIRTSSKDRALIAQAMDELHALPDGPEILRHMCQDTTYTLKQMGCGGSAIVANNQIFLDTDGKKADHVSLAHEALHIVQADIDFNLTLAASYKNFLMREAVACSLSTVLDIQESLIKKVPSLLSKKESVNLYKNIVTQLTQTIQQDQISFAPGLNAEQKEKAYMQCVYQIASKEFRKQYIKDFLQDNRASKIVISDEIIFYQQQSAKLACNRKGISDTISLSEEKDPFVEQELKKIMGNEKIEIHVPEIISSLSEMAKTEKNELNLHYLESYIYDLGGRDDPLVHAILNPYQPKQMAHQEIAKSKVKAPVGVSKKYPKKTTVSRPQRSGKSYR